jgi:hypothetical protein
VFESQSLLNIAFIKKQTNANLIWPNQIKISKKKKMFYNADPRTARPANLKAPDWRTNGLGRKVSHSYGYGLMDTTAMVRLAKNWTLVPPQVRNQSYDF